MRRTFIVFLVALSGCAGEVTLAADGGYADRPGDRFDANGDTREDGGSTDGTGDGGGDDNPEQDGRFDACEHDPAMELGGGDEGTLASGIAVLDVEANQGLGAMVARSQAVVTASSREIPLITDRPTLFRARWQRHDGFVARNIEGRLIIRTGGMEYAFTETRSVDSDSDWAEHHFSWVVPRCLMGADVSWAVGFFDPSGGTAGTARLPASGTAPLEPWSEPMELKVVFVPVVPTRGEGSDDLCADDVANMETQLDFSGTRGDDLRAYLTSIFPVQNVEMRLHEHERISWGGDCNSDTATRDRMIELRNAEALGDNWYYQALVPFYPGWSGYSILFGDGRDEDRTSWAEAWDYLPILSAHELIHSHGVSHVEGTIELWGWGPYDGPYPWAGLPRLGTVKDPSSYERLMKPSAGGQLWIGPDTYSAVAERIRTLTSWDYE